MKNNSKLNAKVAWNENVKMLEELQAEIDEALMRKELPSEQVAEKYSQVLMRVAWHWEKYYRISQVENSIK